MPRKGRLRVVARQPGYDGKREMVAAWVDSPLTPGTSDPVVKNIRESPLATMLARRQIDEAQYEAGSWFRKVYEQTRMGSMAIDPSREPVDTSGQADPIPDALIAASRLLRVARYELGGKGYLIVELVCGQGFTVREQQHVGRTEKGTGWLLRHALDRLAEWRGFASPREK
jgi:hypothetical protein